MVMFCSIMESPCVRKAERIESRGGVAVSMRDFERSDGRNMSGRTNERIVADDAVAAQAEIPEGIPIVEPAILGGT